MSTTPAPLTARRAGALRGEANVPGDKSISHRSLILGALAVGETRITGLLEGEDVLATAAAVRLFGAETERVAAGEWRVHGVGTGGFADPDSVIDCGNSGTGARLLMGAMATTPITAVFTGDASLRSRPMRRVTEPLSEFGARCAGRPGGLLPITIEGAAEPIPIRHQMLTPSAQVKSAILFAGLNAPGRTSVIETALTRDHTERMLQAFGAGLAIEDDNGRRIITVDGHAELAPQPVAVPADPSSASFPIAASLIVEGSAVTLPGVGVNPARTGFLTTVLEMGAQLRIKDQRLQGGEPVADIEVEYSRDARHRSLAGKSSDND